MQFVKHPHSAGLWVNALGINPKTSVLIALAVLGVLGILAVALSKPKGIPMLIAAAGCSVLGYSLFYHRRYDNMMLLPLAIALMSSYFKRGFTALQWGVYGAFFVSVFLPAGIVSKGDLPDLFLLVAPVAAGLLLGISGVSVKQAVASRPKPPP
jgi:hypothetical protein